MTQINTEIDTIGFDADDTLWHTENMFQETQTRLAEMMRRYAADDAVQNHLHEIEVENVKVFGYGIKGFTLSMIETAITMSKGAVTSAEIHEIISMGKRMLKSPLTLMPHAETVLANLKRRHTLLLITKGDLLDQTNKVDKSGLADYFDGVEVLSEKDEKSYAAVLKRHSVDPSRFLMVGNSIPSDIEPVLDLGGFAVQVPYQFTAVHELFDGKIDNPRFFRTDCLSEIPGLMERFRRPITRNPSSVI
ncbi:MAG: HAD family hydrolase [Alphaproteobacteria bacterium]